MSYRRLRILAVLGFAAAVLTLSPSASARVNIGVHVDLPPGVHVSVGNFDPYYVGRVYYQPARVWRPVYSFPVETPYGVAYQPYVYDGGHVVCHDYIPGPSAGYGRFVREGRGYYDTRWYGGQSYARGADWDRRGSWDRDDRWNGNDRNYYERSGSGSGSRKGHKKHKHGH